MKVVMLKEGMERTGEYINRLCTAKENGLIDIDAYIPTATDILFLLELIKKAKVTANGYVIVQGIMFIRGQDYELEQDGIDAKVNELKRLKDRYIIPNVVMSFDDRSTNDYYGRMEAIINNRIGQLLNEEANDNSYIYNGKLTKI